MKLFEFFNTFSAYERSINCLLGKKIVYQHIVYGKSFIDETTGFDINRIEGTWSSIKTNALITKKRQKEKGKFFRVHLGRKHFGNIWNLFILAMSEIHVENF